MKQVHLLTLTEEEQRSPKGKFRSFCKNVSVAFGARRRVNEPGEAHPFDVQQRRVPPGASICPYHSHTTQWELFVVASGRATIRRDGETYVMPAGTAFVQPPGTTHQTINDSSTEDLVIWIIADNPAVDFFHYPDSNKFGIRPLGKYFRINEVDYFDGEDFASGPALAPVISPPAGFQGAPPFHTVTIDALPWDESKSPSGKYHSFTKDVSVALGARRNALPAEEGHPFDLQVRRVPAGAAVCPLHTHTLQWELYVVLAGTATVRSRTESHLVAADTAFLQRPGTAHQIVNTGTEDLLFWVIADNHAADSTYYPNSNKWQIKPQGKLFRMVEADYFDGEE